MYGKIKSNLLTYLFKDWVKNEEDVETLLLTKQMIENRKNTLVGHTPIIGFKRN